LPGLHHYDASIRLISEECVVLGSSLLFIQLLLCLLPLLALLLLLLLMLVLLPLLLLLLLVGVASRRR
jgi:hypothetical protein